MERSQGLLGEGIGCDGWPVQKRGGVGGGGKEIQGGNESDAPLRKRWENHDQKIRYGCYAGI